MQEPEDTWHRPNYLATIALTTGAVSVMVQMLFMFCTIVTGALLAPVSVAGIGAGWLGLRQARRHGGQGREMALVGIVLNGTSLAMSLVWVGFTAIITFLAMLGSVL